MDLDKIEKLDELRQKGMISEEEYQQAKAKILGSQTPAPVAVSDMDNRTYSMLMHFAQLLGFVVPMCGWIAPLVMWLLKREDPYIDQQGRVVFNWIISAFIYCVVSVILMIVLIGFLLLPLLVLLSIIFTVIGALKANDGVIQNYPMSIPFFRIDPSLGGERD